MSNRKDLAAKKKSLSIVCSLLSLVFFYAGQYLTHWYMINASGEVLDKINNTLDKGFNEMFSKPNIYLNSNALSGGLLGVVIVFLFWAYNYFTVKNSRPNEEHGSARFGTNDDIKPYVNTDLNKNTILSNSEFLDTNGRKTLLNNNVCVIGGSGSGKTRFFMKPNILQMNSSMVITDPKGAVLRELGKVLENNGYTILSFNTDDFSKSMHYNPFAYIKSEEDILSFVNTLIANTKGEGDKSGEDFWVKAEKLLYTSYISFILSELPKSDHIIETLSDMIRASETREDNEDFKNAIDLMFDELEERDPGSFAGKQYRAYKLAAGKTAKSILISCSTRLAPFDIPRLIEITSKDEMNFLNLANKKTALFICPSDKDTTFNFLLAIMYTQLFQKVLSYIDNDCKGVSPTAIRFYFDEFANIGIIPNFEKLIAVIRSRGVSVVIFLQTMAQLKMIYKDNAETIVGNCDSLVFLGGKEPSTLKMISESLGKETIDTRNINETKGSQGSHTIQDQKTGRELMTQDEIMKMDKSNCIVFIRSLPPFLSMKYEYTKHTNYKYTGDADDKNMYEIRLDESRYDEFIKEGTEESVKTYIYDEEEG